MTADLRSAWRAHRHGPVVRLAMLLAVLTLAVAVAAMHAMGAGHAGGSTMSASTAHVSAGHGDAVPMASAPADQTGPALHAGSSDHGMGAMCLAVLPLLVLGLAHALRRWRRTASGAPQDAVRRPVVTSRAPPPHLAPDLTGLGISRT